MIELAHQRRRMRKGVWVWVISMIGTGSRARGTRKFVKLGPTDDRASGRGLFFIWAVVI